MPEGPSADVAPVAVDVMFRAAMRRIAATVTILTTGDGVLRHGMTATSMTSLSMDPPSLIVCLNRKTRLNDLMQSAEQFCVNVLHVDQSDLSHAFSGAVPAEERFNFGHWAQTPAGIPHLLDAHTNIFCRKTMVVPYGTHTILIGDVEEVVMREARGPLLYHDAAYGAVRRSDR